MAKKKISKSKGVVDADGERWYNAIDPGIDTSWGSAIYNGPGILFRLATGLKRDTFAPEHEENLWRAYTMGGTEGLPKSDVRFDGEDLGDADVVGLPQEQALIVQSVADSLYADKMREKVRNTTYSSPGEDEGMRRKAMKYQELSRDILNNPGEWVLVGEGSSPVRKSKGDGNRQFNYSGLGGLKNFYIRWNPDDSTLDVKDEYDFKDSGVEGNIPRRDRRLFIRDKIKFYPEKGSVFYRNPGKINEMGYRSRFEEGGVVGFKPEKGISLYYIPVLKEGGDDIPEGVKELQRLQARRMADDKPLNEVHPELAFFPALDAAQGIVSSAESASQGNYDDIVFDMLLGFSPAVIKAAATKIPEEIVRRRFSKLVDEDIVWKKHPKKHNDYHRVGRDDKVYDSNYAYHTVTRDKMKTNDEGSLYLEPAPSDYGDDKGYIWWSEDRPFTWGVYNFRVKKKDLQDKVVGTGDADGIAIGSSNKLYPLTETIDLDGAERLTHIPILNTNWYIERFINPKGTAFDPNRRLGFPIVDGRANDIPFVPYDEGGEVIRPSSGYYASRDNTSVGGPGIDVNANYGNPVVEPVDITSMVASAMPVIGDAMDARDLYQSAKNRDALGMALAAIGFIPFVGMYASEANRARRVERALSAEDKALVEKFPEYAHANSPYRDAWENHKRRLMSGALERFGYTRGVTQSGDFRVPVFTSDSEDLLNYVYDHYNGKYTRREIKSAIEDLPAFSAVGGAFVINPYKTKRYTDEFVRDHPDWDINDMFRFIMSHETEHIIHKPSVAPPKDAFDFSKEGKDVEDYFSGNFGTEAAARGTQIKNYFGLTDDAQEITPEMLEYAKKHYAEDYGDDNNMKEFLNSIVDFEKAAKWLSTHASVGIGAYTLGNRYMGEPEEKREGGPTLYQLGFRFFDHKPEYGDVKDIQYAYPAPPKYSMKNYLGEKDLTEYLDRVQARENENRIENMEDLRKFLRSLHEKKQGGMVEKQDEIYDTLTKEYNMKPIQAIAIIANLTHESNLDETALGDSGASFGLQQWRGDRRERLENMAISRGNPLPTFEDQIEFLMNEYQTGQAFQFATNGSNLYAAGKTKNPTFDYFQYSRNDFDTASNLYDAVIAWNQGVGRPSKKYAYNDRRYEIAKQIADRHGIKYSDKSYYGEMGYNKDGVDIDAMLAAQTEKIPEGGTSGSGTGSPSPAGGSGEPQPVLSGEEWFMKEYGNALVQQMLAADMRTTQAINQSAEVARRQQQLEEDAKKENQAIRESEQQRREREFLADILPTIQLSVKGVSQIRNS